MQLRESATTLVTLANASQLTAAIVQGVVGNELADSLGGQPLTQETIYQLTQTKIQSHLASHLGN